MAFERYEKQRATKDNEVSINSTGLISISANLSEEYLKGIKYAELFYDSASGRVGIKPVKAETDFSLSLISIPNSRRAAISGRGFLASYKLGFDKGKIKPQKYDAKFDKDEKMIVFSIKGER